MWSGSHAKGYDFFINMNTLQRYEDLYKEMKKRDKLTADEEIYARWYKAYKKATKDRELIDKSY